MVKPAPDEHFVIVQTVDDGNGSINITRTPTTINRIVRWAEDYWPTAWSEPATIGPHSQSVASVSLRPMLKAMGVGDVYHGPNYLTGGRAFDRIVRIAE